MSNKGGANAQTKNEMIASMTASKEEQLQKRRGLNSYKSANGEYMEEKIKQNVTIYSSDFAKLANTDKVSLSDIDEVERRMGIYLQACQETGTFPSNIGLARSLGYSDRALRYWRSKHANTVTAQRLESFAELCVECLTQSALQNNCNAIMAIFVSKALYQLRETSEVVISPGAAELEEEAEYDIDDIKKRYLVDYDSTKERD